VQRRVFGAVKSLMRFNRKLSAKCVSERIIKIGQHLAKIWTKVWWHVFMSHGVLEKTTVSLSVGADGESIMKVHKTYLSAAYDGVRTTDKSRHYCWISRICL